MLNPDLSNWYHHHLNPIALQWGDVAISWYWLVYLCGWFWCALIFKQTRQTFAAQHHLSTSESLANSRCHGLDAAHHDFLLWGWVGMLFGARSLYILVYNLDYFLERPDQMIAIWNGGMSFHGGFLGITVVALAIAKRHHLSIFALTDPLALAIPWVLAVGRVANFINGELVGRISTVPWAVVFPPPFADAPRHPSQLYECLAEGLFVGTYLLMNYKSFAKRPGLLSLGFVGCYAAARFMIEYTREPDQQLGFVFGITMGQWLCLAMFAGAILGLLRLRQSS